MQKRLRYRDIEALGIVTNRITLRNWIMLEGFPPGQLTGPNQRTWTEEEIQAWLDSRPTAPKPRPGSLDRHRAKKPPPAGAR